MKLDKIFFSYNIINCNAVLSLKVEIEPKLENMTKYTKPQPEPQSVKEWEDWPNMDYEPIVNKYIIVLCDITDTYLLASYIELFTVM